MEGKPSSPSLELLEQLHAEVAAVARRAEARELAWKENGLLALEASSVQLESPGLAKEPALAAASSFQELRRRAREQVEQLERELAGLEDALHEWLTQAEKLAPPSPGGGGSRSL